MPVNAKEPNFTRFLKDEKFIQWKLFDSDELTAHWELFLHENPDEKDDFAMAEEHFRNIQLSSHRITNDKKNETLKKLEKSIIAFRRKRRIRMFTYVAVAFAMVAILSLLYVQTFRGSWVQQGEGMNEFIVGNQLDSKDIQLITSETTTSFQENIHIELDNSGIAHVRTDNESRQKEVDVAQHTKNTLIVPYGKRSTLTLSDGSKVWLNSGSVLEFPAQFTGNAREIHLASGEMYIEVSPDKQKLFRVRTSDFQVKVHGTKFNVATYGDSPQSIVLVTGSVSLQSQNQPEVFLSPNEQAVYADNGTFHTKQVDVNRFISWKDGYLEFDNTPIAEVLKQIERYYNLSFNYDKNVSLGGLTCTGKIILSENLDNVMTTLALISSTNYHRQNNQIYIRE